MTSIEWDEKDRIEKENILLLLEHIMLRIAKLELENHKNYTSLVCSDSSKIR